MVAYTSSKTNTVRFKAGIITDSNPALVDTLRLAAIMVDPRCVQLFGRMANPTQDRLALDFPELRIQAVKQQLLEILAKDFFNNVNFSPSSQPDIQCWSDGADFDVSVPQEQRSWMWLTQKLQYIKQGMTTLLANFSKSGSIYTHAMYAASHAASHHVPRSESGDLENGMDDSERDMQFWEKFCNRQAEWFWIYMCWERGRKVPSWSTALLPDEWRLDVGVENEQDRSNEV
jgi:hypothetical protein